MISRIRALVVRLYDRSRRDRLARELDDELRFHQAMLERDLRATGIDPTESRRLGRLSLGNLTYVREETRAMWSLGWIDDVLQDLRYAARLLRHHIGFTVAVVLTLALGIGANTAIFSVVNAVVLQPLPYTDPDRLYAIWTVPVQSPTDRNPASYPDLLDWQAQSKTFAGIGGYIFNRFEISGAEGSELARGIVAMPSVYSVLGARPLIGRLPAADEARRPVVAISHRLWLRRYGGDPGVVGRIVTMDEKPYTVIGVMPPGFHFPTPDIDFWMSEYAIMSRPTPNAWITSRGLRGWRVVGRLRAGTTPAAAETEMNTIMHRLGEAFPDENGGTDIRLQSLRDHDVGSIERALWLMLGAAGLVLLLACANVAHLMLARTSSRAREIAVRRALGAHRGRVVRQLLTESVLLGLVGGAVGLGVAIAGVRLLLRLSPGDIPRLENVALDVPTLAFAAAASLLTGVLFGLAPAIVTWRGGVKGALGAQRGSVGGDGRRIRALLTSAEVAFALMLLVGAGLMIRSLATLLMRDPGFRADGVTVFQVGLANSRYPTQLERASVISRLVAELHAIPGVTSVGASTSMPPSRMQQGNGFMIEGDPPPKPGQEPSAIYIPATSEFLPSIGVPLISGRHLGDGDGADAPRVAVINRELARRHFAHRNPLGARLRVDDSLRLRTIVGVVGDVSYEGLGKPLRPQIYVPWAQSTFGGAWIAVRASGEPRALVASIRAALHRVDPLMNPRDLQSMDDMVGTSMMRPRFQTWLLTTFGSLALLLAAVGIYGVIAYSVAQRTSEIGLRLALGAPPRSVIGLVMGRGMLPVILGLVTGVAAAAALSRVMAGLLYDVSPTDAPTFVGTTLLLATVAAAAAYLPASRAAKLDPIRALRTE